MLEVFFGFYCGMLDVLREKEFYQDDAILVMHIYEATGVLKGRGVGQVKALLEGQER